MLTRHSADHIGKQSLADLHAMASFLGSEMRASEGGAKLQICVEDTIKPALAQAAPRQSSHLLHADPPSSSSDHTPRRNTLYATGGDVRSPTEAPLLRKCSVCSREDVAMIAGLGGMHELVRGEVVGRGEGEAQGTAGGRRAPRGEERMWKAFMCRTCWVIRREHVKGRAGESSCSAGGERKLKNAPDDGVRQSRSSGDRLEPVGEAGSCFQEAESHVGGEEGGRSAAWVLLYNRCCFCSRVGNFGAREAGGVGAKGEEDKGGEGQGLSRERWKRDKGARRLFCLRHRPERFVDLKRSICEERGCSRIATWGVKGSRDIVGGVQRGKRVGGGRCGGKEDRALRCRRHRLARHGFVIRVCESCAG
jgi:hypothetical protein